MNQKINSKGAETREDRIREAQILISEITLLSTCLINSLDKLLGLKIEDKSKNLVRHKLKNEANRLLKELNKTVNEQIDFYGEDIIGVLDSHLKAVEDYAKIFSLSDVSKLESLLENGK